MIPNWAHEKTTVPTKKAYEAFGYKPEQFIVSYFGNMGICQEMNTLAEAAEKLKDNDRIQFLFIGHGIKQPILRQHFENLGLKNVKMYDFLTGESFEQAVAISSCCVVSLEKGLKGKGAPSKYYSYLQGGKPVITIVEEGSYLEREVLSTAIGGTVHIGDSDALCEMLLSLEADRESTALMGQRAMKLYEDNYAYEIGMSKYLAVAQQLLCKTDTETISCNNN